MSVEQYSNEIIVVATAEGPSDFKIWLRPEAPGDLAGDLAGDLQWLCEEYLDNHIILDLSHLENLAAASYKLMLDLHELAEDYGYRFVLCGISPHLQWQLNCMRLSDKFDTFDTRQAAIAELLPEGEI
jgi:anti-anti-sigma regulatory factor